MFVPRPRPLVYGLKPGYEGVYAGAAVRIDAEGQRVVRPRLDPPPGFSGSDTLLLIGDSHVFGQGVRDHETLASQLQDSIYRRGYDVRVVSIGVPGYSSWNEHAALGAHLEDHRPETVVLVYSSNDMTFDDDATGVGSGRFKQVRQDPIHRVTGWIYRHSYAGFLLGNGLKRLRHSRRTEIRMTAPDLDAVAFRHSMTAVEQMRDEVERSGGRFLVGIYRDFLYYVDRERQLQVERDIGRELDRIGVRWFVAGSHVERLPLRAARVSWSDFHPSAQGLSLLAGDVAALDEIGPTSAADRRLRASP